ncbi:Ermin [Heterocephalus glaber]|uniref:Ermin n=1 Tax=Heterocephalus glaber TaxID=10181 RepID=G5BQP2_HETGA|nr:ermin [Heterocephalus glaber]EHB11603.1 Ermin [Heterocephalus glaber]
MTDIPKTFSGAEYNGDSPLENDQQTITKINDDTTDVDETPPYHRAEPSREGSPTKGTQEESGKSQGNMLLTSSMDEKSLKENPEENLFIVHKAIADLSLPETRADEMTFREGHQWEKIPLHSTGNQEIRKPSDRIMEQLLEETDEESKSKAHPATEIEWLGFQRPSQVVVLHSKQEEEQEVWDEETNDDDICDDEDEVRVIEFKKKHEEGPQFKEDDASEDSPLRGPSSQPVTPDEPPALGKKGDITRNAFSRYNTISYRKIRKGNTKQRIDEFESMMHL